MRLLLLLAVTAPMWAQFGAARQVVNGNGAPNAAQCASANNVGMVYARKNGEAAFSTFYVCGNTAAGTYAWELMGSGGGGGGVSSVAATGGVQTSSGSAITTTGTLRGAHVANVQTGTTYTFLTGDRGNVVTFSNASSIAVTLPQAGTGFENGWFVIAKNIGAGDVTITPTTSTISGTTAITVSLGEWVLITSDGTNYEGETNRLTVDSALSITRSRTSQQIGAGATLVTLSGSQTLTNKDLTDATNSVGPNSIKNGCTDSVGTDAYACSISPAITTYTTNRLYTFVAGTANTGAATINFNGLGAKTIVKVAGGVTTALADNDIRVGQVVLLSYDGTNMQMQSTLGNAGGTGTVTPSSVDTFTNKTIDSEATGNVITLSQLLTFTAANCQGTSAFTSFATPTANAPSASCVTGSNTNYGTLDFDAATNESVQYHFPLPSDWTGNIDITFRWRAAATSGDVVWAVQTICVADGETGDPSFNTASTVTDTAKGTTLQWNDASISSITITGCAAGEELMFKLYRDAAAGGDTMAGDAQLIWARFTTRRAQ